MFTATRPLCRGGMPTFWRKSLDEFKRQAGIAIRMEGLRVPQKPFPLIQFTDADAIDRCKIMCDSDSGGFSKASLTYRPGAAHQDSEERSGLVENVAGRAGEEPAHVLFKGSISTELPPNRPDIQRSGYAAWRTRDRGYSMFGKLLWDVDPFANLALRIKSDGRKYFVNIQTESIIPTDLHQHLLPCNNPGQWETVFIPLSAFVRTSYGMVVEPQSEMLRQKVRSVGIGLTDRVPGPFEICIADVYATNMAPPRRSGMEESGFAPDLRRGEASEDKRPTKHQGPEQIMI